MTPVILNARTEPDPDETGRVVHLAEASRRDRQRLTVGHFDQDAVDLVEPGFIEVAEGGTGQFGFIAVRGWMDCLSTERGGRSLVEFSRDGDDEGDQVSGRGWAALGEDGALTGHLFIHEGDDSGFRATPFTGADTRDGR